MYIMLGVAPDIVGMAESRICHGDAVSRCGGSRDALDVAFVREEDKDKRD